MARRRASGRIQRKKKILEKEGNHVSLYLSELNKHITYIQLTKYEASSEIERHYLVYSLSCCKGDLQSGLNNLEAYFSLMYKNGVG